VTRPLTQLPADTAAVRAIAQAAINVELFTIPLYMAAAYSIQGTHPIVGKGNDFYAGRLWPGPATTANPQTPNEHAFNLIFSVFCEEMLHLQLAANIASALGVRPTFTSSALQDERHGWICYGPDQTVIPHIVDLLDTAHANVVVALDGLTAQQVELFQILEEPASIARTHLTDPDKYFPVVPFEDWTAEDIEVDLPMFGTVDWMYQCYYEYLTLTYDDGTTLWEHLFTPGSVQNDLFNVEQEGHPAREYRGFRTTITATDPTKALIQVFDMIDAITDQGEGSILDQRVGTSEDLFEVAAGYQADHAALEVDYPAYGDTGEQVPSADAVARYDWGGIDHYERFIRLAAMVNTVTTWPQWHIARAGQGWIGSDLVSNPATGPSPYGVPDADQIAEAMNRCGQNREVMYPIFSQAALGAIAGVTTVLDQYWAAEGMEFPSPAMVGSADRMAICWALFGQPPDLSLGIDDVPANTATHACQSLDLSAPSNGCAPVGVYHSCRGSNSCRSQGGCGFVQPTSGGGSCGMATTKAKVPPTITADTLFSAPSDNMCAELGGCAVPISASQVFDHGGTMALYDGDDLFDELSFAGGELVHVVAYRAYLAVLAHREGTAAADALPSQPPPANDLRLVFPPST
jgi:hypothetical protein